MSDFRDGGIRGLWKGAAPLTLRGGLISAGQIGGCESSKKNWELTDTVHRRFRQITSEATWTYARRYCAPCCK